VSLFYVFKKFLLFGFFSFGGGYTMLTLMQEELVIKLRWLTDREFLLALTAGQISPGPVAVAGGFAGFLLGYNSFHTFWWGFLFAFVAWIATSISTIICMSLIMKYYDKIQNHQSIEIIQKLLIPAVIGLIFTLGARILQSTPLSYKGLIIFILSFILARSEKVDYAFIIIGGMAVGFLL